MKVIYTFYNTEHMDWVNYVTSYLELYWYLQDAGEDAVLAHEDISENIKGITCAVLASSQLVFQWI